MPGTAEDALPPLLLTGFRAGEPTVNGALVEATAPNSNRRGKPTAVPGSATRQYLRSQHEGRKD
jgi:hypothetical protein